MNWIFRHRCRIFLRSSLWAAPVASMTVALMAAPLIRLLDDRTRWALLGFGLDGARSVVGALASSLLTFVVFAFSIILLAVQVAGAQLSPLVVTRIFEGRLVKMVLSAFVFSFTYAIVTLGRIEGRAPQLPIVVAFASSMLSVALFLYLIQMSSQSLRQGTVLPQVAADTRKEIYAAYPNSFTRSQGEYSGLDFNPAQAHKTVVFNGRAGAVVAFDSAGLAAIARRAGCAIELVPQVGDFLASGETLFRLYGRGARSVEDSVLHNCVALGTERSLEENPAFGFRILVDIAIKALSPAINDPTTAVMAIDHIHHLLHLLGSRQLDSGVVRDDSGEVRLLYRAPSWKDFVTLAVTEIRMCGANSPQVTRRLQAMFQQLVQAVPEDRCAALVREMALLRRTIDRSFDDPEDRLLAAVGDLQGFGSPQSGHTRAAI